MNENHAIIIENECNIIKPIIKKRNILSEADTNKVIIGNSFSSKKKDTIENSIDSEEKNEDLMNCIKSKAEYSIIEILNILSQPIVNGYSKRRHFLQKDLSDLYENNDNEFRINETLINENDDLFDLNYFNKALNSDNDINKTLASL